ncbi:hypothetical protein [Candidatus Tisiphia endosymbiont of Sialis lutaria]|uniref:hypothetical protein n=1 Tax=Candidatus Tisiphia endosymbiont of Sialis lutaria TaxID=2029164 RepID=UPI00312CB931
MVDKNQNKKLTWMEIFEKLSLIPTGDFFDKEGRADSPTEEKGELNKPKYNDTYPYFSDF